MSDVLIAFGYALRTIWHPRMLALAVWPMLAAIAVWLGLAWFYWDHWSLWWNGLIAGSYANQWLSQGSLDMLARYSAFLLLALLLAPLILITAVLLAALMEMPKIVNFVVQRTYPLLEKRRGGTVIGGIANALVTVLIFSGLWMVALPLLLTGVLAPVVTVMLSAYLNQRLFRYDALSDHASADEYRTIVQGSWGRMYVLGALMGVLYFVPLFNLLVPVLSGLGFTHFCLSELARLREQAGKYATD